MPSDHADDRWPIWLAGLAAFLLTTLPTGDLSAEKSPTSDSESTSQGAATTSTEVTGDRDASATTSPEASADDTLDPPADPTDASDNKTGPSDDRFSLEHRRELYRQSRLSPWAAVGWTFLLPGLGNLYAEQYLLAGLGFVSFTFSGSFLAYGYAADSAPFQLLGYSFAALAYGGGLTTSLLGVRRYNRNRRQSLGLDDELAGQLSLPGSRLAPPETVMLNFNFSF